MNWRDVSVDIKSLSPGAVCPCPGAIYMYKIMKKIVKIRLQRYFFKLVTNDWSDKKFLLTSKFCPQVVVSPSLPLGYIHVWPVTKKRYELGGWRRFEKWRLKVDVTSRKLVDRYSLFNYYIKLIFWLFSRQTVKYLPLKWFPFADS